MGIDKEVDSFDEVDIFSPKPLPEAPGQTPAFVDEEATASLASPAPSTSPEATSANPPTASAPITKAAAPPPPTPPPQKAKPKKKSMFKIRKNKNMRETDIYNLIGSGETGVEKFAMALIRYLTLGAPGRFAELEAQLQPPSAFDLDEARESLTG